MAQGAQFFQGCQTRRVRTTLEEGLKTVLRSKQHEGEKDTAMRAAERGKSSKEGGCEKGQYLTRGDKRKTGVPEQIDLRTFRHLFGRLLPTLVNDF